MHMWTVESNSKDQRVRGFVYPDFGPGKPFFGTIDRIKWALGLVYLRLLPKVGGKSYEYRIIRLVHVCLVKPMMLLLPAIAMYALASNVPTKPLAGFM